jgi:hypothetical protein
MTTAAAPEPSAAERHRLIADRQKRSVFWWLVHRLGSLNFALVLLVTIAVACAAATFAESSFSSKIARAYIYKNPLFVVWLAALCVNLFAVTLTRWPWQKKHTGFIITHYGIITLLAGAMVGMLSGFEGNVTLNKNAPPVARVTTSRSIVWLDSSADPAYYIRDFDAEVTRPSEKRPREFPIPETDLKVVADAFSPNLVKQPRLVPSDAPSAGPGVLLRLDGTMAQQTLEMPLLLSGTAPAEGDFFGMAKVVWQAALPEAAPPAGRETRMVFAKFAPVAPPGATTAGTQVRLSEDGAKVTILSANGTGATYLREEILGKPIADGGATVTVEKYWPDFAMENGQPVTKSPLPNNPAVLVRLSAPPTGDAGPRLDLAPGPDGSVAYQIVRAGQAYASGKVRPGESFALGWADWKATVVDTLPKAVVVSETVPGPELPKGSQGVPGFRAHLVSADGTRGPDRWVESGQVTKFTDGTIDVRLGYGLEPQELPFSIGLVDFQVPRDEGTDTPADFRASVEFRDAATGETRSGLARMNQPASFPGTLWANLTGINYKFSQAEWNPRDLNETTLQVLYDPGWMLKWIGSLAICIGIAIMFYGKPKRAA